MDGREVEESKIEREGKLNYLVWMCERPRKSGALKKKIRVLLRASLFSGKWCGVAIFFFLYKKRKEKISTHYMIKILHCHWLNKENYNFDKLTLQGFGS